jgi:hypothetical protein
VPPSQSDPLIYLVENYVPGSGGETPIDTLAMTTSNQITNPQFALINFTSPFTFSGTDPSPIQIGPSWYLEAAGTGSVTLTQVPLTSATPTPSNAPYALEIELSGWNDGTVFLRQRFSQNGVLWANQIVSTALTARIEGSNVSISAKFVNSMGDPIATVLNPVTVDNSFNEYIDYATFPASTDTDTPPNTYIDYKIVLPSNVDIYITSVQVIVEDMPIKPPFEQDSIERQIDHTYNTAYPIVPVGTVIDFGGFTIPSHYFLCDGTTKSRTTYNLLFQAITKTETVSLTSTVSTFTVLSSADYYIGMSIEGTGIAASTTISNIVGTTITMSNAATATVSSSVRFFAYGNGDGSTTFTLPLLADYVIAGLGGTLFGAGNNGVGAKGGSSTHTLLAAELPPHSHTYLFPAAVGAGAVAGFSINAGGGVSTASGNGPGSSTAFSIVQQTALMKKCIRYE